VSRYHKGKTNLDSTEARDSEWQWHQLGHMQVFTSLQTGNRASTPLRSFYRRDALPAAQPTASKYPDRWISVRRHRSVLLSCERCWWQLCRAFNCIILYDHYLPTVILILILIIIGIPSPTHSFTLGLNPSFFANPPYPSLSFISFRIHYMDFLDCLLLLLSTSVFLLFSFSVFTHFWLLVPCGRLS